MGTCVVWAGTLSPTKHGHVMLDMLNVMLYPTTSSSHQIGGHRLRVKVNWSKCLKCCPDDPGRIFEPIKILEMLEGLHPSWGGAANDALSGKSKYEQLVSHQPSHIKPLRLNNFDIYVHLHHRLLNRSFSLLYMIIIISSVLSQILFYNLRVYPINCADKPIPMCQSANKLSSRRRRLLRSLCNIVLRLYVKIVKLYKPPRSAAGVLH